MANCTFFGHRDYNSDNRTVEITPVLIELIENKSVDTFYIGNQGNFDTAALLCLRELQVIFSHIKIFVVLAYHPSVKNFSDFIKSEETLFPEELDKAHPRFAVAKRNEWMISKSDYAVVFSGYNTGGTAKYKAVAEKKNLTVINLYNCINTI